MGPMWTSASGAAGQAMKPAVADNNIFALFVDSGNEKLLTKIVGVVVGPPSIIDPDPQNRSSEFNRLVEEISQRKAYLGKHGVLWVSTTLTPAELQLVSQLGQQCKKLKNRRGDLEALALAISQGYLLLTDDGGLREEATGRGVRVKGSCGLLEQAVVMNFLTCQEAARIYNEVFTKELGLYTNLTFVCPPGTCQKKR